MEGDGGSLAYLEDQTLLFKVGLAVVVQEVKDLGTGSRCRGSLSGGIVAPTEGVVLRDWLVLGRRGRVTAVLGVVASISAVGRLRDVVAVFSGLLGSFSGCDESEYGSSDFRKHLLIMKMVYLGCR